MYKLPNLTNITEEELDAKSIPAVLERGRIQFDENIYEVQDGVMIFERPLKTESHILNFSTLDRMSIIKNFDTNYVYVFAISVDEEHNENIKYLSRENHSRDKGYTFYVSWSKEEVDIF